MTPIKETKHYRFSVNSSKPITPEELTTIEFVTELLDEEGKCFSERRMQHNLTNEEIQRMITALLTLTLEWDHYSDLPAPTQYELWKS
jgi:tRNA U54 and U55 pseudouridine synthase Pus10